MIGSVTDPRISCTGNVPSNTDLDGFSPADTNSSPDDLTYTVAGSAGSDLSETSPIETLTEL